MGTIYFQGRDISDHETSIPDGLDDVHGVGQIGPHSDGSPFGTDFPGQDGNDIDTSVFEDLRQICQDAPAARPAVADRSDL